MEPKEVSRRKSADWIDDIGSITNKYISTIHSVIEMTPIQASIEKD